MSKRFIGISRNFALLKSSNKNLDVLRALEEVAKQTRGVIKVDVTGDVTGHVQVGLKQHHRQTLIRAAQISGGDIFVGTEGMDPWEAREATGQKIAEGELDSLLGIEQELV